LNSHPAPKGTVQLAVSADVQRQTAAKPISATRKSSLSARADDTVFPAGEMMADDP
jgi:hypothetical protein